jgi:hypothetical protein
MEIAYAARAGKHKELKKLSDSLTKLSSVESELT